MGSVKILKASAGSGKTYRLAYEYIKGVVIAPELYRATLAVTFTNKATEQMKRRIIEGLDDLAHGQSPYMEELHAEIGLLPEVISTNAATARSLILHDYSRFAVSTIDKFFQRVARAFFKELGLDFDYSVEIDNAHILAQAVDNLLRNTATNPALRSSVGRILDRQSEYGRGWDIRPLLILIGGELFKEGYIPNDNDPLKLAEQFDAITNELAQRHSQLRATAERALTIIDEAGLELTDFKGGTRSFAFYFNKLWGTDTPTKYSATFAKAASDPEAWHTKTAANREQIKSILPKLMPLAQQIVDQVDGLMIEINTRALVETNSARSLVLGYLDAALKATAAERSIVMIHQTPALIERLVKGNDAGFIYEKVGNAYSRYMIDEFQDTSQQQWNNFLPLLENSIAQTQADSVMLIGDVKQSIYRWRGGNWRILASQAEEHFAESLAPTVAMDTNWRSECNIIEFNNRLIRSVVDQDTANLADILQPSPNMTALALMLRQSYDSFEQRPSPGKMSSDPQGYVRISPLEASLIPSELIDTVTDMIERGYEQRDIVVLVRTSREASEVADTLLGAGYSIVSQEALLLGSSPVVEFVMATFALSRSSDDHISRAQWNNFMKLRYGEPIAAQEMEFLESIAQLTPTEGFERIVQRYSLGGQTSDVSFLQAIYQAIVSHAKKGVSDIPLLLEWWNEFGYRKPIYLPSEQNAINIQTIHKAKGLEYPCVIIPFCDWKLLPSSSALTPTTLWVEASDGPFVQFGPLPINYKKDMSESHFAQSYYAESVYSHVDNINLLYVALTRAERELHIMYDSKPFKTVSRVSHLIDMVLPHIDGLEQSDNGRFTYGKPCVPKPKRVSADTQTQIVLSELPSSNAEQMLRISWASDRYFGGDSQQVTPRRHGILMHRLFGLITNIDHIESALEQMERTGEIQPEDRPRILTLAKQIASDPTVRDWFDPRWTVRSECDIISTDGVRRPDRVMTDGVNAVVVDYKFGALQSNSHKRQVRDYMSILGRMGYTSIEGYLWYVELGEVKKVVID